MSARSMSMKPGVVVILAASLAFYCGGVEAGSIESGLIGSAALERRPGAGPLELVRGEMSCEPANSTIRPTAVPS